MSYALSDKLGELSRPEAGKELEKLLSDFNSRCSIQIGNLDGEMESKRKYVSLSQETYIGTAKRVYKTHHVG